MAKLDSVLKSRDIILLTKIHIVKAMVFPVVTYGCESWTVKKAEHQRMDTLELCEAPVFWSRDVNRWGNGWGNNGNCERDYIFGLQNHCIW